MPIDTTPSTVATSALQAIPFGTLIGGPLDAAIQAQATAAKTTSDFINSVGFDADGKAKQVIFEYNREGKIVTMIVPLLTIVPIPYIQIDTININFKANISASSSSVQEASESTAASGEANAEISAGWGPFSVKASFKANYSSKKDSKSTQDSRYSVEYTMDLAIAASQSSMPTGLSTVLNILSGSIAGSERGGQITLLQANQTMNQPNQQVLYTFNVKDDKGVNLADAEVELKLGVLDKVTYTVAVGTAAPAAAPYKGKTDSSGNLSFTVGAQNSGTTAPSAAQTAQVTGTATIPASGGGTPVQKTATGSLTITPAALPPSPPHQLLERGAAAPKLAVLGAQGQPVAVRDLPADIEPEAALEIAHEAVTGAAVHDAANETE
jgi:hypothetical protein